MVTAPRSPIGPRTPFHKPPPTSPRGPTTCPRQPLRFPRHSPSPHWPLPWAQSRPPSRAGPIPVRRHLRPMRGGSHPSYKSSPLRRRPVHAGGGGVSRRFSFTFGYAWMAEVKDGGCCIARYNAGNGFTGGGGGRRSSQVDQIMLRFRPIAPKPSSPCPPDYAPPPAPARNKRRCGPGGRTRCGSRSRRKQAPAVESAPVMAPVTLPLLPEAPEPKSSPERDSSPSSILGAGVEAEWAAPAVSAPASVEQAARAAWAFVTVERVGEASGEVAWEEMRRGLESEEAGPVFVTDACNCVRWVNDSFRKMVGGAGEEVNGGGGGGVMVALVAKEKLPGSEVKAFTCRVRVQYTSGEKERHSLTAPCDVWRMEGGRCTWRLDVKAALSLGR